MCGCCCESCSECIDDRDGDCTTPVYQIILCCPCICAFMCLYPCCWKPKKEPARREKTAIVPTNVYATQTTNWATGLRQAVIAGNIAEIQRLLALGADLEDRDMANGQRVLHNAAYLSTNGVLKSLLAAGANYQAVDNMSRTPLHHAAMSGSVACIDALIQAGANHEARDKYGHTPLDLARTYRRAEAIEFLASARPLQAYIKPAITRQPFEEEEPSQRAPLVLSTDRAIVLDLDAPHQSTDPDSQIHPDSLLHDSQRDQARPSDATPVSESFVLPPLSLDLELDVDADVSYI
eukprot:m.683146 g.683146  ORF g.683146 m.683146 type:complete len:293 (-) comp58604_c0_seq11:572-1450(-)